MGAHEAGVPLGHPLEETFNSSRCSCTPHGWTLGLRAPGSHPRGDTGPPSRLCHHSSCDIKPVSFFSLGVSLPSYTLEGQRTPLVLRDSLASEVGDTVQRGRTSPFLLGWSLENVRAVVTNRLLAVWRPWAQTVPCPIRGHSSVSPLSLLPHYTS